MCCLRMRMGVLRTMMRVIALICLLGHPSASAGCGGNLYDKGQFLSYYLANQNCKWTITVPTNHQVALTFQSFELKSCLDCSCDYLEVWDGDEETISSRLAKFCGKSVFDVTSSGNKMTVRLVTDRSTQSPGFIADFSSVVDKCKSGQHTCEDTCTSIPGSYVCNCNDGYRLNTITQKCEDVDECKGFHHGCAQQCINTRGGYYCWCYEGYQLDFDGKTCIGDSCRPWCTQVPRNASLVYVTKELSTAKCKETPSQSTDPTVVAVKKAKTWILNERQEDGGWGKDTPRAIIALYFSDPKLFISDSSDLKLMAKELELQLTFDLITNQTKPLNLGKLSLYVIAFLATCHNPEKIHGLNLVQELRKMTDHALKSNEFISPFVFLTLCLREATIDEDIEKLDDILQDSEKSSSVETEAIALMALTCIANSNQVNEPSRRLLDELLNSILVKLISSSRRGKIPGNFYSSALVAQALQAYLGSNQFDKVATVENLLSHQQSDGSFGSLLATYYIIPTLVERSILDLSLLHCKKVIENHDEISPLYVLREKKTNIVAVRYSLWQELGEIKITTRLAVRPGTSFLDIMNLARSQSDFFRFESEQLPTGLSVYSIGGVPNDIEQGMRWTLYFMNNVSASVEPFDSSLLPFDGNASRLIPTDGDEIIFWYRHQS